jgi:[protein-PII] uridylyltransferase
MRFLYPLWDKKSVDHSVRTRSETREAASTDLRVATGLLDIRLIAGNADLVAAVQLDAIEFWRKNAKENLADLHKSLQVRHARSGELAYLLEPDLKEARGGLRDIQALRAISLSAAVTVPLEKISWAEGHSKQCSRILTHCKWSRKGSFTFSRAGQGSKALKLSRC